MGARYQSGLAFEIDMDHVMAVVPLPIYGKIRLISQCIDWLEEHGEGDFSLLHEDDRLTVTFVFTDERTAFEFKMRYG